jgi:hypothetical protein
MGLAERRATKEFQDKSLPSLKAEIEKLAGFAVPIEINWEQLAREDYADSYDENWKKVFFQPVINALKKVTRDQMGKDAIKSGLKRIVLCNTKGAYSPESAITFAAGDLTIDHDPASNVDYVDDRATHLVKILEKNL